MKRIQRRRVEGWRMPPNTVNVGRPSKWGNPYSVKDYPLETCLAKYEEWLDGKLADGSLELEELRGKDLMCWCALSQPCHADILLERLKVSG